MRAETETRSADGVRRRGVVLARKVILAVGPWARDLVAGLTGGACRLNLQPIKTTAAYWQVEPRLAEAFDAEFLTKRTGNKSVCSRRFVFGNTS